MKTVYDIYSASSVIAHNDPLGDGVIMPANSTEVEPPDFDPATQTCRFIDGEWVLNQITVATEETQPQFVPDNLIEYLRSLRNGKLTDTDWRMLPDYQGSDVAAWKTYRQSLRDVPQNNPSPTWNSETGEIENVNWPTPPSS